MNPLSSLMQSDVSESLLNKKETLWINPYKLPFKYVDGLCQLIVSDFDIDNAEALFIRFAPFIKESFPETAESGGIIESPLTKISSMQSELEHKAGINFPGNIYLKQDSHLHIAGSVKARGGIYEVLKHAETLALEQGKIKMGESYIKFATKEMKEFLSQYTVQVGSTGNLGLSIGIMSAALGFKVKIHMSVDAKQWKKDLLKSKGVEVIEYSRDYSLAVSEGRKNSQKDPNSYFVDDEWSVDLFLGYAVAARRLQTQLNEKNIQVNKNNPLFVYIPAGVGGAPGGICYGLKRIFGDNVHCFFAEPTIYPSVLLGIATQKFEKIKVGDFGITGSTDADGLACASPSGFVTRIMTNLVSGIFTVSDKSLYDYLKLLCKSENIKIEPSACAGFSGPDNMFKYLGFKDYLSSNNINEDMLNNSNHIIWATGGKMVPDDVYEKYLNTNF